MIVKYKALLYYLSGLLSKYNKIYTQLLTNYKVKEKIQINIEIDYGNKKRLYIKNEKRKK